MTNEQAPGTEPEQAPSIDYDLVAETNMPIIRDFENAVREDPAAAERLLGIASRLFEGSAFSDLVFDESSEKAIDDSGELPVIDRAGLPEHKARQSVAIVLKRGALFAARIALNREKQNGDSASAA